MLTKFASRIHLVRSRSWLLALFLSVVLVGQSLGVLPPTSSTAIPAFASTTVSGVIGADTTWTLGNSPYIVTGNVLVNSGVRLTIEPGVMVKFDAGKSIQINGELVARGASNNLIIFTSNTSATPASWGYIFFNGSVSATYDGAGNYLSGSALEYCTAEYGGGGVNAIVQVSNSSPLINHCTIQSSGGVGLSLNGVTSARVTNNTVLNNAATGIMIDGSSVANIVNNQVRNNAGIGINVAGFNQTSGNVQGNVVTSNGMVGIQATIGNQNGTIQDNIVSHNGTWGIYVNGDFTITRNLVFSNLGGGAYIDSLIEATQNILADNQGRGYSASVFSPHFRHNAVVRNTGDYPVFYAAYSGARDFTYNTITQNHATGPAPNNTAVLLHPGYSGVPLLNNNNVFNNVATSAASTDYPSSVTINSKSNWWGTAIDAGVQAMIYDWNDDSSRAIVDYSPFLTAPDTTAPVSPPSNVNVLPGPIGTAQVNWSANPESDVIGYRVYYGTSQGYPYANVIDVGNTTSTMLSGLGPALYYIAVTAYDSGRTGTNDWTNGNESWFSEERFVNFAPPTSTPTPTLTPTSTMTLTPTLTLTSTMTRTPTLTLTSTMTRTPTLTPTSTLSPTVTITPSVTPTLNTTPPSIGGLTINGGALATTSSTVNVSISATGVAGPVTTVSLSNDGTTWSGPQPYSATMTWILAGGDGLKTVAARVQDSVGNTSPVVTASITLDTTVRSNGYGMSINGNPSSPASNQPAVTLWIGAPGGTTRMRLANDTNTLGAALWEPFNTRRTWAVPRYNVASYTLLVYAEFQDSTGNFVPNSQTNTFIIVDTTPPTGTVSAAGGGVAPAPAQAQAGSQADARPITLGANDDTGGSGVVSMRVSNRGDFARATWEAYSTSRVWDFASGNTVYVQFRDAAGNISQTYSASTGGPPLPTPTVLADCSPRPPVSSSVQTVPGVLRVTLTAQASAFAALRELRITRLDNAVVENLGGQPAITGPSTVALTDSPPSVSFTVRRVTGGQASTVELTVVDSCGTWPTFVGGGPSAF